MTSLLGLWQRLARWPGGAWLFSRAVCFKAPYFGTISPRFTVLEDGRCEAVIKDRRRMRNHIGTVHAIALCNLAELTAGVMTDASLPRGMRWIPKGMSVQYLKKATGTLRGDELPVSVGVFDSTGEMVFSARIGMWLSPSPARKD